MITLLEHNETLVNEILAYATTLIGIKYEWWNGQDLFEDGKPFWVGVGEVPRSNIISCSCTGLLNLIRRQYGLSVPGLDTPVPNTVDKSLIFPGGMKLWLEYLFARSIELYGCIETFDESKHYRKGSLLVHPNTGRNDQGHIAIIYTDDDKNNPLNNEIIHSYPYINKVVSHCVGPGVIIEPISITHKLLPEGVYKYVFTPETWLQ